MHQSPKISFAMDLVYCSYLRAAGEIEGLDAATRDLSLSRALFKDSQHSLGSGHVPP